MCARAGGDVISLEQQVGNCAGVLVPDVQRHNGSAVWSGKITVNLHVGEAGYSPVKAAGKPVLLGPNGFHAGGLDEIHSGGEPRDAVGIQGTRLQAGGHILRLLLREGVDPRAAYLPGAQLQARAHAQPSGALGAHQSLVADKAQHVNTQLCHIQRKGPGSLGRVHRQDGSGPMSEPAYPGDVHHIPGQIGGVGADYRVRALAD